MTLLALFDQATHHPGEVATLTVTSDARNSVLVMPLTGQGHGAQAQASFRAGIHLSGIASIWTLVSDDGDVAVLTLTTPGEGGPLTVSTAGESVVINFEVDA